MVTISLAMHIGNEKDFIREAIESALPIVDEVVVIIDERENDGTQQIIEQIKKENPDKEWYIERRKFEFAKTKEYSLKKSTKDWVLFLDGDEIFGDGIEKLKIFIENNNYNGIDFIGHHFIYSLGSEDNSVNEHVWSLRMVRNLSYLSFVGDNHAGLAGLPGPIGKFKDVEIYHMGYIKNLCRIMYKCDLDRKRNRFQIGNYAELWKNAHISGQYPVKLFDMRKLPKSLKKKFHIEHINDEVYFEKRLQMEPKFYEDAITWAQMFQPTNVLCCGTGAGQRVYTLTRIGINAVGFDISEYIIKKNIFNLGDSKYHIGDVTDKNGFPEYSEKFDLVVAYDLLEHLTYDGLNVALENIHRWSKKWILISVPFKGEDLNLEKDETHKIKEERRWWMEKLSSFKFRIFPAPEAFPFAKQILIGEKLC